VSATWRLLVDDDVDAAEGLALDEVLMGGYELAAPPRPPTLRLYGYRDYCALVGRYQNLEAELDVTACGRAGVQVGRRPTGGGAIVMGKGQLGIAYVDRAPRGQRPRETIGALSAALVAGLAEIGIKASFHGKNDLEVAGRKIAGLGLYVNQAGAMLLHASVLADLDVAFMLRVLKIPAAKLGGRAVDAVQDRLTTVSAETGTAWDGKSLRPHIAKGFEASFGVALVKGDPTLEELAQMKALAAGRYRSKGWLSERSLAGDANGSALLKTPAGLVRIYVSTHGDLVKSAMVVGDFNELPPSVAAMESGLCWRRLTKDAIVAIIGRCGAADALGVSAEELAGTVMQAGEDAFLRTAPATSQVGSRPLETRGVAPC
jgi:lipoate-protein ligase A